MCLYCTLSVISESVVYQLYTIKLFLGVLCRSTIHKPVNDGVVGILRMFPFLQSEHESLCGEISLRRGVDSVSDDWSNNFLQFLFRKRVVSEGATVQAFQQFDLHCVSQACQPCSIVFLHGLSHRESPSLVLRLLS